MDFWTAWAYRGCHGWHNSPSLMILKDGSFQIISLNWEGDCGWKGHILGTWNRNVLGWDLGPGRLLGKACGWRLTGGGEGWCGGCGVRQSGPHCPPLSGERHTWCSGPSMCVFSASPLSHSIHTGASPPWDLNQMLNIVAQKEVGGMASDDANCATYFPLSHT